MLNNLFSAFFVSLFIKTVNKGSIDFLMDILNTKLKMSSEIKWEVDLKNKLYNNNY